MSINPPSAEIPRALFQSTVFHANFTRFLLEPEHKQSEWNQHPYNSKSCLLEDSADKTHSKSSASSSSTLQPSSVSPAADAIPTLTPRDSSEQPITSTKFDPVEALEKDVPVIEEKQEEHQGNNNGPVVLGIDNGEQAAMPGGGHQAAAPEDVGQAAVPWVGEHAAIPVDGEQAAVPGDDEQAAVPGDNEQAAVPGDDEQAAVPGDGEQAENLILNEQMRSHPSHATPPSSGTEPLNGTHN